MSAHLPPLLAGNVEHHWAEWGAQCTPTSAWCAPGSTFPWLELMQRGVHSKIHYSHSQSEFRSRFVNFYDPDIFVSMFNFSLTAVDQKVHS